MYHLFTLVIIILFSSCISHKKIVKKPLYEKKIAVQNSKIVKNSKTVKKNKREKSRIKSITIKIKERRVLTTKKLKRVTIKAKRDKISKKNRSKNKIDSIIRRCYQSITKKDLFLKGRVYISCIKNKRVSFYIKIKNKNKRDGEKIFYRCMKIKLSKIRATETFKRIYKL